MSENIEQDSEKKIDTEIATSETVIENTDADIEIDNKKWLYAFYAKVNGENKKFYISKPGRKLKQGGELEYAKQLAKFVKAGLLPKAAWGTILDNAGGTISENDAQNYTSLKSKFFELSLELNKLQQGEQNEENLKSMESISLEIEFVKNKIQSFELEQIYIFENTAESKARNATIEWWLCNLSFDEDQKEFFQGPSVDDKLDWYDSLDPEKDADLIKIGQRFSYLITLWFLNKLESFEDFKNADIARQNK
jgi:hypothetical protein